MLHHHHVHRHLPYENMYIHIQTTNDVTENTAKYSKRSRTFDEFPFINHLSDMKTRTRAVHTKCTQRNERRNQKEMK